MPRALEDLTGQLFGTRRVLRQAEPRFYGGVRVAYWTCRCETCRFVSDVQGGSLRRGAGCPRCTSQAQRRPYREPPAKNMTLKIRQKQLTVGGLQKLLAPLPPRMHVRLYLVSARGWALGEVKTIDVSNSTVMLVTELPARLERWPSGLPQVKS